MKKLIIFFFIVTSFISACSPQVTVASEVTVTLMPTETPIPTPTLNPEFIALQELISDLSENLTLLPNGAIENNSVVIPNLKVDENGQITILVNSEIVIVDSSEIAFDDENQLTIKGYKLNENGEWIESVSEATILAQIDFEGFGYDYNVLTFSENEDGKVVGADQDGNVVYEDGKFSFDYAVEQAGQLDLMSTNIKYRKDLLEGAGFYGTEDDSIAFEYFGPLFKRVREQFINEYGFDPYQKGKTIVENVMLNPEILAWGQRLLLDHTNPETDTYLYYELADGTIHIVPLQ